MTQGKKSSNRGLQRSNCLEPEQGCQGKSHHEYRIIRGLDRGAFGMVYLVRRKSDVGPEYNRELFAAKVTRKCRHNVELEAFRQTVGHPYLVKLESFFETKESWFYVMEYMAGGNMRSLIKEIEKFPEETVQFYAAELTLAVEFLHVRGIIHRDIKPENILLDEDRHCKLGDFGLAALEVFEEETIRGICGTPLYRAPEVVLGISYGPEVDWWAVGVVMHEMMVGKRPFVDTREICAKCVKFPSSLTCNAVSIMEGFLNKMARKRLGTGRDTDAIRRHPFFNKMDWEAVENKRLKPPIRPKIQELPSMDPGENGNSDNSGRHSSFKTAEEGPQQDEVEQPHIMTLPSMDPGENGNSGRYSSFKTAEEGPQQDEVVQPHIMTLPTMDRTDDDDSGRYPSFKTAEE